MFQPLYVRELIPGEHEGLERCAESSNREEASRAEVILLSSEGKTAVEIGQALGAHPSNIKKWIRRFNKDGLNGIAVKKRGPQGGPRPRFSNSQIEEILGLAERAPSSLGYRFKEWTPQKLATAAMERNIVERISHVTVRQLLKRNGTPGHSSKPDSKASSNGSDPMAREHHEGTFLAHGEASLAQSRYEAAAELFYSALTEDVLSPEEEAKTRSLLSKALEELSKYEEAYKVIEKYEDPRLFSSPSLTPRTKARLRLRLGWINSFLRNHAKAIAALNEAKRLFLEMGDDLGMSETQYALGRTYIEINEFRIARDHLLAAASNQKTVLDRELLAQIHRRLGTVDYCEGAFTSSRQHYLKALEIAEGITNINLLGGILVDIGTTLFGGYPGENQESIRYMERGIDYLEKG
ncbi:MAG TPA: helix-turn-helix domain-containing protein, partial [Blastocatellia bacterium]|nr:helix-turn-helix domain-containing protein [Blastocatellia bacterium]